MVGLRIAVVVTTLMILVGACQKSPESGSAADQNAPSSDAGTAQMTAMPVTDPNALWQYIAVTEPYTKWKPWPGKADMYPGKSPHGAFLKLYVNPIAFKTLQAGSVALPDGAILVKENYGEDRSTLVAVTTMYKVSGYNPAAGDWFWTKYGPDGKVMTSGKVQSCIDCHKTAPGDDWLFTELP